MNEILIVVPDIKNKGENKYHNGKKYNVTTYPEFKFIIKQKLIQVLVSSKSSSFQLQ